MTDAGDIPNCRLCMELSEENLQYRKIVVDIEREARSAMLERAQLHERNEDLERKLNRLVEAFSPLVDEQRVKMPAEFALARRALRSVSGPGKGVRA